jgi:alpha-mannosidase
MQPDQFKTVVHLIPNAHIDPIWLWPWSAGVDEVLNTCESVCGLLERNPDATFSRGEAWAYEIVEKLDPKLFERIKALVAEGRWEIVGGWYVQPDCNLPSETGFRKQVELGREYFLRAFGKFPRVAYNVDSFGHGDFLPDLIREAGQDAYVMMRPMKHEKELPARFFRWRSRPDGAEVLTFRIPKAYCTPQGMSVEHIQASLEDLPSGIGHTMSFVGIGDHGGGPSEELLEWCRKHRDAIPGVRLEFSSTERFFNAIRPHVSKLPVVTGELQMHAIGCYSVYRRIKNEVRLAEHALRQAELALGTSRELTESFGVGIREGWKRVCFHHFHDTLGGTCLSSAYPQVHAQLGSASAAADEALHFALRRHVTNLSPDPRQGIVLANYSDVPFGDWIEHEPWLEWTKWQDDWCLLDEDGKEVPAQIMTPEALNEDTPRLLFFLSFKPGEIRILRIARRTVPAPAMPAADWSLDIGPDGLRGGAEVPPLPDFEIIEDRSDTWSHGLDRYDGEVVSRPEWESRILLDEGPLLQAWETKGKIGRSPIIAEWRVFSGARFVELRFKVFWQEELSLLRLSWAPGERIEAREDLVAGGAVRRESDGREYPVQGGSLLLGAGGKILGGVAAPDTYSLSSTKSDLRLTLLRSSAMCHHDPSPIRPGRRIFSDQGWQEFFFRFFPAATASVEELRATSLSFLRRPVIAETTKGMPWRPGRGNPNRPL